MYKNGTVRTTPCSFLKDDFCIDSFGGVYYCFSASAIVNVLKESRKIGEIYFDPTNQEKRKKFTTTVCRKCNSGCNVYYAVAWDLKKWLWYLMTGKLGKATS
jgi:hypothetical protein